MRKLTVEQFVVGAILIIAILSLAITILVVKNTETLSKSGSTAVLSRMGSVTYVDNSLIYEYDFNFLSKIEIEAINRLATDSTTIYIIKR